MPLEETVRSLIGEMLASGHYRALLWAGGYPNQTLHEFSDVDLYAVSVKPLPSHWSMERIGDRRVELTAYPLDVWRDILDKPYRHPKHHYTFANGQVLHDPESLIPALRQTAAKVLGNWPRVSSEAIEELRNGVAIQRDKIAGFREKKMPLHLRMYSEGFALLACRLFASLLDGYSVDAGKSLTRILNGRDVPEEFKKLLFDLLTQEETDEMACAALHLADLCLEYSGGNLNSYKGGILR